MMVIILSRPVFWPQRAGWWIVVAALAAIVPAVAHGQMPTPVVNNPQVPADVNIPAGFMDNPIAFFDDYSWRAFIAMVWPALNNQRGQPDPAQTVDGPGPRVFETLRPSPRCSTPTGRRPCPGNSSTRPYITPAASPNISAT
jgi:hypothetical protein